MILEIDPRSAMPPYEQLRQQVTALVLGGALATGDRLPAIRQLANDLGLAGGTVARAYRELESDGVVTTHGRHGTVIAGPPHEPLNVVGPWPRVEQPASAKREIAKSAFIDPPV